MNIPVNEIEPNNIGAIVSFDYDPNGLGSDDPAMMRVMGELQGVFAEERLSVYRLMVGGKEFEMDSSDTVDMRRNATLSKLHKYQMNNA